MERLSEFGETDHARRPEYRFKDYFVTLCARWQEKGGLLQILFAGSSRGKQVEEAGAKLLVVGPALGFIAQHV